MLAQIRVDSPEYAKMSRRRLLLSAGVFAPRRPPAACHGVAGRPRGRASSSRPFARARRRAGRRISLQPRGRSALLMVAVASLAALAGAAD